MTADDVLIVSIPKTCPEVVLLIPGDLAETLAALYRKDEGE